MFVRHHQLRVKLLPLAKAIAIGTRALRGVEREETRRDFGDGEAADRAGEFLGKDDAVGGQARALHRAAGDVGGGCERRARFAEGVRHALGIAGLQFRHRGVGQIHKGQTIRKLQRRFKAFGQTLLNAVLYDDTVNDDLNVMLIFLVERGRVFDGVHFAVDADAGVAGTLPLGEFLAIFALAALHHGGKQERARALW